MLFCHSDPNGLRDNTRQRKDKLGISRVGTINRD